jgi:hypothetical protein
MINPTGGNIRHDKLGTGYFGAPREKIENGRVKRYRHRGVDYVCIPGQDVYIPFTAIPIRKKNPCENYHGILFRGKGIVGTLFYVKIDDSIINMELKEGDVIGIAEDISQKFEGVLPHVHFQIDKINPELLISIYRSLRGRI